MLPTLLGRKDHDITKTQGPAFTMNGRFKQEVGSDKPGPNKYQTSNITRYGVVGEGALGPVVKGRVKHIRTGTITPGPDKYDVTDGVKVTRLAKPPSFSLSGWSKYVPPNINFPGPQYALPTYINGTGQLFLDKGSPAFAIKSRVPHTDFDRSIPGPLAYGATPLDITKRRIPQLVMLSKPQNKEKVDFTPAANKYDANIRPIGKSGPFFSMASRHSAKVGTMRTKRI
ncbi:hypothetical protein WDU94_007829 [Cyamophila willieti]